MSKSKEPIRLRQRRIKSGLISLYLDIYQNGIRSYEYLKLYLVPERTRADKEKNKQTLLLADAIRAKRIVELRNGQYGFQSQYASNTRFFDYYRSLCEKRLGAESRGNWGNWYSCLHHLKKYEKRENITFADITPEWVQGFKDYLENEAVAWGHDYRKRIKDKPLARNSKVSYFNKLRACLNQAYEERIIPVNPLRGIDGFKAEEGTRMYLTIEEVQKLAQTPCDYPQIKAAFLFFLPHGVTAERCPKVALGRRLPTRRVYTHHIQTEENRRTGIPRHHGRGCGTYGGTRQTRRLCFYGHTLPLLHKQYNQIMGCESGYFKRYNLSLRPPYIRYNDVGLGDGHIHCIEVTRTSRTIHDTDIRKGS